MLDLSSYSARAAIAELRSSLIYEPSLNNVEWSEKYLNFEGEPFRFRPYQLQPARDLFNPLIRSVTLRAFAGFGKTIIMAGSGIGYGIEAMQLRLGVMYPSEEASKERLEEKIMPLFQDTPKLSRLKFKKGLRGDKNLAFDKSWLNGGRIQAVGSNSPQKIRVLETDVTWTDESDSIYQDISDEGDKVDLLESRTRESDYGWHWRTSYPSRKNFSRIDKYFDQGDQCRWLSPCVHCGDLFEMHTRHIKWQKGKAKEARIECPSCGRLIDDTQRFEMSNDGGRFVDRWGNRIEDFGGGFELAPEFNGERSFHVGCLANVGRPEQWAGGNYLYQVVTKLESIGKASNPEKARQVFVNTMDAESFELKGLEKPDAMTLYNRRENYNPAELLPAGVLCLRCGADVHKNRIELHIVGFGKNEETWGCGYKVVWGSPLKQSTWNKFFAEIGKPFSHPSGKVLRISGTAIDSAYRPDDVFKGIRGRSRVWAVRGARTLGKPIANKPTRIGRPPKLQYPIGTHEAKDQIYQRLQVEKDPDSEVFPRGYMHFPETEEYSETAGGEGTGFFEMLTAQDPIEKQAPSGEWLPYFENLNDRRDEALDTTVYAFGAVRIGYPPNFEKLFESIWGKAGNE